MEPTSAAIPLPQTGSFDEETCRYFLREIGEQIVPFYPFSFGIEEVYSLLLERYGEHWVADALSVLHELMEAEDNASGLGDDGDIWRSWRHSWRHRNDDPLKPFIPTIRGFVLPPPTSQASRRVRAAGFSTWSAATPLEVVCVPFEQADRWQGSSSDCWKALSRRTVRFYEPDNRHHNDAQEGSRKGYNAASDCASDSDREEIDSQQDFEEVKLFAESIDFDRSQLISFEMMIPPSGLRGGETEFLTFRPVRRKSCDDSPLTVKHKTRISQRISCQVSNLGNPNGPSMPSSDHDPFTISDSQVIVPDKVFAGETSTTFHGNDGTLLHERSPQMSNMEAEVGVSFIPLSSRRTFTNRNARLIDGAIFTPYNSSLDPTVHRRDKKDDGDIKRPVGRSSWSAVRQKEPLRHSLIQGVRGIFRKDQQSHQHKRGSSLLQDAFDRDSDMISHKATIATPPPDHLSSRVYNHSWGLDGACDDVPRLPRPSPNLNKPLPVSPGNPGIRPTSLRTGTPLPEQSRDTPIRPSTASSVSSNLSTASSKRDFRGLTRTLINEDMGAHRPDLSPVRESETLSPTKYNPRQSMQSSVYSDHSYKSTTNMNPFREEPVPLTPGIPLPLFVQKNLKKHDVLTSPRASRTSPSPSLLDVQPFAQSQPVPQQGYRSPTPPLDDIDTYEVNFGASPQPRQHDYHSPVPPSSDVQKDEASFEAGNTNRGRTSRRTTSPSHSTYGPSIDAVKPQKRSRSPVKNFLGFGKSTSSKNIANEPRSKSSSTSPEKRTPLKSWGNRFRHGFLTTDDPGHELILSQSDTPPRRVTPTASPLSTFPISLDPPYQAKILSELELMICVSANKFLMEELEAGRLSDDSITKIKHKWAKKNRPQVLEFSYDQATQRELIIENLQTVRFHGECAHNGQVLNATMYNWNSMANEMAIRTFCTADSAIQKYMHDSHKVLEMLGGQVATFLALSDLQVKTLAKINDKRRQRHERHKPQDTSSKQPTPGRRVGTPAPVFDHTPKSNKTPVELNPSPGFGHAYDVFENSRGGRLGKIMKEMADESNKR